jgi:ornithine carbamoyltransferase
MPKHFLDLADLNTSQVRALLERAKFYKKAGFLSSHPHHTLAMIFEKPSTRTRVSFDMSMRRLGGDAICLSAHDLQLGRGETIEDTARVLSRYVSGIMIRTTENERLRALAKAATVPVINGLTNRSHPCQVLADILTLEENLGDIQGKTVAWLGDINNVCHSWIEAAQMLGFTLNIAAPTMSTSHLVFTDPFEAARNADVITTDTCISMGIEDTEERRALFAPYQVNAKVMAAAKPSAIFLHCLPAMRGGEVTAEVIDGAQSKVWDEAENRVYAQQAVLEWCFSS